jgi:hypothetical protein
MITLNNKSPFSLSNWHSLIGFFLVLIFLYFSFQIKDQVYADSGAIEIDMFVNSGGRTNLWVNDQSKPPLTANLEKNVRKKYVFKGIYEDIKYLRIDPVPGTSNKVVKIFNVEIKGADGRGIKLSPEDLGSWTAYGSNGTKILNDGIEYLTGENTILVSERKYDIFTYYPKILHSFIDYISRINSLTSLLMFLFFGLIFLGISNKSWINIPLVFAIVISLHFASKYLAQNNYGSISVDKSVGLAAFSGHSLTPNSHYILFMVLMSFLIPLAFSRFCKVKNKIDIPVENNEKINSTTSEIFIIFLFTSIFLFPDFSSISPRNVIAWGGMYVPNWDSDNAVAWAYMVSEGLLPFKDFWYPYAFSFLYDFMQPWGFLFQYLVTISLLTALYFLVKKITGGLILAGAVCISVILLGGFPSQNILIFPQPERHLLPFVIALSFLIAINSHKPKYWIYLFSAVTCGAILLEPSQVVYAAPSILVVCCLYLFQKTELSLKRRAKVIFLIFLMPALFLSLLLLLICLFQQEASKNISDMYLQMQSISNYMAVPTGIDTSIGSYADFRYFLICSPFIFFTFGFFKYLNGNSSSRILHQAIMVVSLIGIFQLQKHIVRPINWALFYSLFLSTIFYISYILNGKNKLKIFFTNFMLGVFFMILVNTGSLNNISNKLSTIYSRFVNAKLEISKSFSEDNYYANKLFSSKRLRAYDEELKLVKYLNLDTPGAPKFYSMPDNPILYVIAKKIPPYQINGFSMSPVFEQKKIVEFLKNNDITYIVIDPSKNSIDGFSYTVRLPELYKFAVKNYSIDKEFGKFYIAKKASNNQQINLDAWSKVIGSEVNLGYIPNYSKIIDELNSEKCIVECESILKVKIPTGNYDSNISIPVVVKGVKFTIKFSRKPELGIIYIPLDKIWFWPTDGNVKNFDFIESQVNNFGIDIIRVNKSNKLY